MKRSGTQGCFFAATVVLSALLGRGAAEAALIVTPTVTPAAGGFRYDYTITNDLLEDVIFVDVLVAPLDDTLTNLFAPAGFLTLYDSILGRVSFLPELGSFDLFAAGTSIGGFGFESALPPRASSFEALTLSGDLVTGRTEAPLRDAVPEPGSTVLLVLGSLILFRGGTRRCES